MRLYLFFFVWMVTLSMYAQEDLKVVCYNVENLFDYQHDSLKNDSSFLPDGDHHWTYSKYQKKVNQIAQVIVNIAGWESVPLVGLCEVENKRCLQDLCYRLRCFHYAYVHYESEDERGIDVALLYDSTKVQIVKSKPLAVDLRGDKTRDILYTKALYGGDTIHIMVCHLPSQFGGSAASEWKRDATKNVVQQHIDSITQVQAQAQIVVMGDMNTAAKEDLASMHNLMIHLEQAGQGTHKYQGVWSCLDQFYVSAWMKDQVSVQIYSPEWLLEEDKQHLDYRPKRTFIGYRYHGGYSDHLPIVLTIKNGHEK